MEIKNGINLKTWRKEVTCHRCEIILIINWKDVSMDATNAFLSNKLIWHFYIKCPECRNRIKLKDLPYLIKKAVDNSRIQYLRDIFF